MIKKIGVTGTTGFVGSKWLQYHNATIEIVPLDIRTNKIESINLLGIDAIVHLAGKAHQYNTTDEDYFKINYELTKALAQHAVNQSVPQFVYISSTKVYGEVITEGLSETSACHPTDAYGASKLKAEKFLLALQSNQFKVAIVRPPLVYGPAVKGNMLALLRLAKKKYPLPFANTNNQRSMVYIDNLLALIETIIHQQATGIFVAGDAAPISTTQLIQIIKEKMGNKSPLISVPNVAKHIIRFLKPGLYSRLFGSFVVSNAATNQQLQFTPPISTEQGIASMVDWFTNENI
jgi:nucleoside-diphosphate-sugar epimerase